MTNKQLLADKIDSILYWAEELKALQDEAEKNGAEPNYADYADDISWISYVMINRGNEIREILKESEFN